MSEDKLIRTLVYRDMSLCHCSKRKKQTLICSKTVHEKEFHTMAGKQIN